MAQFCTIAVITCIKLAPITFGLDIKRDIMFQKIKYNYKENIREKSMVQSSSIEKLKREILLKKFEMIEKRRKNQENLINKVNKIINNKEEKDEIFHKTQINYYISKKGYEDQSKNTEQRNDYIEEKENNKIENNYKTENECFFNIKCKTNVKHAPNKSLNFEQHKAFRISKPLKHPLRCSQGLHSRKILEISLGDQINDKQLINSYPYEMLINLFTEFKGLYRAENYFRYNNLNMYKLEEFLSCNKYKQFKINIKTVEELAPFFLGINKEIKEKILHMFCSLYLAYNTFKGDRFIDFNNYIKLSCLLKYNISSSDELIEFWVKVFQ